MICTCLVTFINCKPQEEKDCPRICILLEVIDILSYNGGRTVNNHCVKYHGNYNFQEQIIKSSFTLVVKYSHSYVIQLHSVSLEGLLASGRLSYVPGH